MDFTPLGYLLSLYLYPTKRGKILFCYTNFYLNFNGLGFMLFPQTGNRMYGYEKKLYHCCSFAEIERC